MKVKGIPKAKNTVTFSTKNQKDSVILSSWWKAKNDRELTGQLLGSAAFLKENQAYRYRQTGLYARLYGNISLYNTIGTNTTKMDTATGLPADRPTFNLIQSATDTLVSRISQSRPAPVFLTDNGDYKERRLAKQLNNFILGEFYQTKTYEKATTILRDALVTGTGVLKVYEGIDDKVAVERVLCTELLVDPNEALYGEPRQLYQLKLVDREQLKASFPKFKADIEKADAAYPDSSADSSKTVSDLVMVVEGWHLRSGPDAKDGRHTIACTAGVIHDEEFTKDKFPFAFLHYSPRLLGFWAQGLAEQLMGTQLEINSLLYTISKAIKLVGVPRVFIEMGSKVVKSHNNNEIGTIITYQGTKPSYEVAQCVPQELYAQLQRVIDYGYQQSGVSALAASSTKPAGLDSGEAIRSYDDISTDRMATLSKRYDTVFVDLAYLVIDCAKDICERTGKYQTVYPNEKAGGVKEIDLPEMDLLEDPFVIQCFNMSSLPRDPSGRMAKVTEMIQAGMISIKEGRRLLDFPDLSQMEKLANASEERIFQILDKIVEDGEYTPPDSFMDLQLATELTTQYYNLYVGSKLEEERCQMLRDFFTQIGAITQQAATPPPGAMPPPGAAPGGAMPAAAPQALPQSPLIPNGNPAGAGAA
jgi:hypothetical protein